MNDKDLIKHGEIFFPAPDGYVLRSKVISGLYKAGFRKAADYCKALSIVPHEMSAREYLETEARMCKYYGLPCAFDVSGLTVDEAIEMVARFAQEHPEERSEK